MKIKAIYNQVNEIKTLKKKTIHDQTSSGYASGDRKKGKNNYELEIHMLF